jgi:methylthioribose-1-phosphate isomerase
VAARSIGGWDDVGILIDRTLLPGGTVRLRPSDPEDITDAIRRLAIGGAPALSTAAALGVAPVARSGALTAAITTAAGRLRSSRSTGVDRARGVERAPASLDDGQRRAARSSRGGRS